MRWQRCVGPRCCECRVFGHAFYLASQVSVADDFDVRVPGFGEEKVKVVVALQRTDPFDVETVSLKLTVA